MKISSRNKTAWYVYTLSEFWKINIALMQNVYGMGMRPTLVQSMEWEWDYGDADHRDCSVWWDWPCWQQRQSSGETHSLGLDCSWNVTSQILVKQETHTLHKYVYMLTGNEGGGGEMGPYLTDSQLSSLYIWTKSAISTGSPSLHTHTHTDRQTDRQRSQSSNHIFATSTHRAIHNAQGTEILHKHIKPTNHHYTLNKQSTHTHTHTLHTSPTTQETQSSHLTSMTVYLWSVPSASSNSAISNSVGSSRRTGGMRERERIPSYSQRMLSISIALAPKLIHRQINTPCTPRNQCSNWYTEHQYRCIITLSGGKSRTVGGGGW